MASAGKRTEPLLVLIEVDVAITRLTHVGTHIGDSHLHSFLENPAILSTGVEGFAFFKSDRRSQSEQFWVKQIDRFTLNHRVQLFKEVEIIGMHRVEDEIASLHKSHRGRVVFP